MFEEEKKNENKKRKKRANRGRNRHESRESPAEKSLSAVRRASAQKKKKKTGKRKNQNRRRLARTRAYVRAVLRYLVSKRGLRVRFEARVNLAGDSARITATTSRAGGGEGQGEKGASGSVSEVRRDSLGLLGNLIRIGARARGVSGIGYITRRPRPDRRRWDRGGRRGRASVNDDGAGKGEG